MFSPIKPTERTQTNKMVATLSRPRLKTDSKTKEGIKLWAEHPEQPRSCSITSQSAPQTNAAAHLANSISSITVPDSGNFMELKKAWLTQGILPKPVVPLDQYRETQCQHPSLSPKELNSK